MSELQTWELEQLNAVQGLFSYQPTIMGKWLMGIDKSTICLFTGNQMGKTKLVAWWIVQAIFGLLPIEHHNIRPSDSVRIIRCASEVLPVAEDEGEVKNTQYPALRSMIPETLIKRDVTVRRPSMILFDPQGGPDITIEFVSYGQTVQQQAGVQRRIVWIDEHAPRAFYEEQIPRLLKASAELKATRGVNANAALVLTLTPAQEYLDWEYDELFERASLIYRTPSVLKRLKERMNESFDMIEKRGDGDIAVVMAATDDNPVLDTDTIDKMYERYADEDVIDIRRYGIFKQISGIVFKSFDQRVHVINKEKYFPQGMPFEWLHARGIDYHESNPWACGWACISTTNEMFIYDELYVSPEKYVTSDICSMMAFRSGDYTYFLNLIDPLADKKQSNTGLSALDDINRTFYDLRKQGIGKGGFWQTWDTKSQRGRDDIKLRLKNSKIVGRPFNNQVVRDGVKSHIPTIWIMDKCKNTIEHMKNWRREQWKDRGALLSKDPKDTQQEKYSHFPMVWEGILKSPAFSMHRYRGQVVHDRKQRKVNFAPLRTSL